MVAVPLECPEQQVEMVEEDISPNVEHFDYRQTDEGVRQMLIGVPLLSPREEAHALVIYEVQTSPILPPEETATLHAPAKPDHKLKRYLGPSPFIDANHRKIKQAVKEALAAADDADNEKDDEAKDGEGPKAVVTAGGESKPTEDVAAQPDNAGGEKAKQDAAVDDAKTQAEVEPQAAVGNAGGRLAARRKAI